MSSQPTTVSPPWRRLLRISVRGLAALVLVVGAWLGWIVGSARIQRETVEAIENENGFVSYDCGSSDGKPVRQGARPWYLKLLAPHVGIDYLSGVASVIFSGFPSVAKLALVARLQPLKELQFDRPSGDQQISSLTDAGLAQLERQIKLQQLDLSRTNISDAGLVCLKGLTELRELDLSDTRISDVGLVYLEQLTRLERLSVRATDISNAGVRHLRRLVSLHALDVYNTRIDDIGVQELRRALRNVKIEFRGIIAR
jgi:hypothetical protein